MQNTGATYRERLTPSLWALIAAAVVGPMAALVFAPFDATVALVVGAVVGAGILGLLVALSSVVTVADGVLRAGRAHIDAEWLGEPVALSGEAARAARGPELDQRAWLLIRGGIDGIVIVPITDPDDPATAWVISSRTPDRLAAAIVRAKATPRSPRRSAPANPRDPAASGA